MTKTVTAHTAQVKFKIKKGDNVVVIAGKDKGKTGKVLQVIPESNKAVVEGVNIVTRHQKPKSAKEKGGIIKKPAPLQISNLMVVCSCGKATRVGKGEISGRSVRICKKCGASLDKEYVKNKKESKKKETETKEKKSLKKSQESVVDKEESVKVNESTEENEKSAIKKEDLTKQDTTNKSSIRPTKTSEKQKATKITKQKVSKASTVRRMSNRGK
jgi:large subunit ribosomal protein L24